MVAEVLDKYIVSLTNIWMHVQEYVAIQYECIVAY